ncbi:MAG: translocation/assembly module TamB domain-containing protein, partial [Gammaproteobacteria bacterium]|nr:translocation/assembly module TamB domain-containing protein [Gammaproteobacteria bacterium]
VKGGLLIPNANFVVQEIPAGARKPSGDAVVMGREVDTGGGARRANVDIDVTLGDGVSFAGFGLTTDLAGNLRVQVAPSAPVTGLGRISLVGGRYEAYGQDLEIERGELIFSGPINNPLLDLRAVRRMPDVTAGIHVTGTPSQLSSEVFSEPAMSEVEALSYLLTGHALATADMGEGDLMNKAAFALGMSQAGAITSQVRSSLGLETLTLQGGIDDSRIVAGKRIGGRLLVEYGYGLVDQLGTLILKYQVNERLVLESSTGSVSTLDIIYKVRRK